jgi:hypothetical protein
VVVARAPCSDRPSTERTSTEADREKDPPRSGTWRRRSRLPRAAGARLRPSPIVRGMGRFASAEGFVSGPTPRRVPQKRRAGRSHRRAAAHAGACVAAAGISEVRKSEVLDSAARVAAVMALLGQPKTALFATPRAEGRNVADEGVEFRTPVVARRSDTGTEGGAGHPVRARAAERRVGLEGVARAARRRVSGIGFDGGLREGRSVAPAVVGAAWSGWSGRTRSCGKRVVPGSGDGSGSAETGVGIDEAGAGTGLVLLKIGSLRATPWSDGLRARAGRSHRGLVSPRERFGAFELVGDNVEGVGARDGEDVADRARIEAAIDGRLAAIGAGRWRNVRRERRTGAVGRGVISALRGRRRRGGTGSAVRGGAIGAPRSGARGHPAEEERGGYQCTDR